MTVEQAKTAIALLERIAVAQERIADHGATPSKPAAPVTFPTGGQKSKSSS